MKVLVGLSGGVDSSVVAALIHRAIGDQLTCMFVDHGLLRKGEAESVVETFDGKFNMNFIKIDAQERFLSKLKGVSDPEQKRKIIGNEFVYCFDEESSKLKDMKFLAQGTLYTDIIESGTDTAQTIKSHHNVGGLPEDMEFELIEPLNTLFKDETPSDEDLKTIPPFIFCRYLGSNPYCLTIANFLNQYYNIPIELQYKAVKPLVKGKLKYIRYISTAKTNDKTIENIMKYYKISYSKAKEYLDFISEQELEKINNIYRE